MLCNYASDFNSLITAICGGPVVDCLSSQHLTVRQNIVHKTSASFSVASRRTKICSKAASECFA